jgi:exonuclease III
MVVALLLLLAGVERNPGPAAAVRRNDVMFGSINIHSAVDRAALIHTIIADHNIDCMALQETWIDVNDPNAIVADIAPAGYGVLHVHRPSKVSANRRLHRGGGLAIIYHQQLNVKVHRLQRTMKTVTFEHQIVAVKTNNSTGVIIINIYRPPSPWIAPQAFFEELSDMIAALMTSSSQAVIVCGDLNCHGDNPDVVDDRLVAVFDAMSLNQHVHCPTRETRLLDVLACSDDQVIGDVIVDDAGNVSDHRLIKARLKVGCKRFTPVTYNFRPVSKMDFALFEQNLLKSSLFTAPENTVDAFADQLRTIVSSTLDRMAPLRTVKRTSGGKYINRFLSEDAKQAKQNRRRLERRWKKTGAEADRLAYRQQCKLANGLINESRTEHYAKRISDINASAKNRWSAVHELLHSNDKTASPLLKEAKLQCNTISAFFNSKVRCMKELIATRLSGLIHDPFFPTTFIADLH